jgi:enoyl-CoA hydratase/carnithine racemase
MNKPTTLSSVDRADVRTITLDEPAKANAISAEMVEELLQHLEQAYGDGTRVLVFKGNGRNFCGGFDLSDYQDQSEGDLLRRFVRVEELLQAIRHAPCLTIACVQGAAYGAGADLAAACNFRIGVASTRLRFPGFQFGIVLGTRHLTGMVGTDYAREILLKNAVVDGPQALAHRLLTHLVDVNDFDSTVAHILEGTSGLDTASLKRLLANTMTDTRDGDLADLVRLASAPGIHERIAKYRNASAAKSPSVVDSKRADRNDKLDS